MTPELAKKVAELVEAGATVLGPKPKHSPSLVNYPACDAEVQKIADEVWGKTETNVDLDAEKSSLPVNRPKRYGTCWTATAP